MFRVFRCLVLLFFLNITTIAFSAVECAGFSKSGTLATAAVNGTELALTLSGNGVSGPVATLKVELPNRCGVSFSADEKLVAVSLLRSGARGVQVGIFDLGKKSWVTGAAFTPKFARLSGGFVGETHEVATAFLSGQWQRGASIAVQMYAIDASRGTVEASGLRPLQGSTTALFENSMDSSHNRLWYRSPGGKCGVRSVTVLGEDAASPEVPADQIPSCYEPSIFDFPTAVNVIIGTQTGGKIQLWRIDLRGKEAAKLEVPADPKSELQLLRMSSHSPDGNVVAIAMRIFRRDKLGALRDAGYEIALVQVDPWRVIATLPVDAQTKNLSSLAVDHRDGHAMVQAFGDDHWTRTRVDVPR